MKYLLVIFLLVLNICHSQIISKNDDFTGETISYKLITDHKETLFAQNNLDGIVFINSGGKFYKRVFDNKINVKWYGAKGDGDSDDSQAFQKALKTGLSIYVPAGTYKINANINKKVTISGDSDDTILKPYNITKPVLSIENGAPYWTYATTIENLQIISDNYKGYGVAFGNIASKQSNNEYAGNVVFKNVLFSGFEKAFFAPYGNIGCNFYNCSFQKNYYGVYSTDNKLSGDAMHAGNKYFYGCEFSENVVGAFINNETQGFGGVSFNDVIFQFNNINTYIYTDNTYIPISYNNCWDEGSGIVKNDNLIIIDYYQKKQLKKKSISPATFIFDGESSYYNFSGGRLSNISVLGSNIIINSFSSNFEYQKGVGAAPSMIQDGNVLNLIMPNTKMGIQIHKNIKVVGNFFTSGESLENTPQNSNRKIAVLSQERSDNDSDFFFKKKGSTTINLSGSLSRVSYPITNSNDSTINVNVDFKATGQYMRIDETIMDLDKGYYTVSVDLKINNGKPNVFFWDRNAFNFFNFIPVDDSQWHTYVAKGYFAKKGQIFLDFASLDGSNINLDLKNLTINKISDLSGLLVN